jgi:flagellar hook-length control protein FliK
MDDVPAALGSDVFAAAPAPAAHAPAVAPSAPPAPEQQFAIDNHAKIVTGVRSTLLPNGGTMQIRLDPPELGALQISIHLRDGVMSASFETSNDEATNLLSHSLSQLKTVLESQGVNVEKLHVQQAPRNEPSNHSKNDDPRQQQGQANDSPARREQERRELLRRMWRKLTDGSDPLDMVA